MIRTARLSIAQLLRSSTGPLHLRMGILGGLFCASLALFVVLLTDAVFLRQQSPKLSPAASASDCGRTVALCRALSTRPVTVHEMAHAMRTFGYVEFDWDNHPGGIPGFGPLREGDARVLADVAK